ncbi:MAG TPA: ATP-dependent DNA helicase RecG [Gammaproteobacteria bacterium]|nr:ATP-dependent DNA helicase RecG [Gammaproteobacteria bacterium]
MTAPTIEAADAATVPITVLKGVGGKLAERLAKLRIETLQDLLFHLPLRYEDRTRIVPIGSLRPGNTAVVEGEVQLSETVFRGRRSLLTRIGDGSGALTLRFFHFSAAQAAMLKRGVRVRCYGEARPGKITLEMIHPEYRIVSAGATLEESLTPIYPTTEGLGQPRLRGLTAQALARLEAGGLTLPDWLPETSLARAEYPALRDAVLYLHNPPPDADCEQLTSGTHPAQRRLAFEELLAHHLSLKRLRVASDRRRAWPLPDGGKLRQRFLERLPFELTAAQQRVDREVRHDLAADRPMMRLVQGDVGSGKTVMAALAVLAAVAAGRQAAVMAPTELLAEQHFHNFNNWLEPLGIQVAWLSGTLGAAARRQAQAATGSGKAAVIVGTHALFQAGVEFADLALIVIDEQHRFGVHQRLALREKGEREGRHPHQLIMTATPIPRTLAQTAYADLDTSVIDELPPGRQPVKTVVMPESRRNDIVESLTRALREGRQAYWVCPLIEESEVLECQAAEDTAAKLTEALPEWRVGLAHGRMKPAERKAVMAAFKQGKVHLLVATTVIEVGVDVPNASLMIIENAERLGLAQLHQLRGRVGRGSAESSCVLLYRGRLSAAARARLNAMRETTDGFEIARRDLALRGPGEVLGTRQTGTLQLKIADIMRDEALLPWVQRVAGELLTRQPESVAALIRRWIGDGGRYGNV